MIVDFAPHPPAFANGHSRATGGRAAGILYERKVQQRLVDHDGYLPSPWIRVLRDDGKSQWAQPDGLFFDLEDWIIRIFEVKIKHCSEARDQLRRYRMLVGMMFPNWTIHTIEIVKWLDPDTRDFGPFFMCKDPWTYKGLLPGVHIMRV